MPGSAATSRPGGRRRTRAARPARRTRGGNPMIDTANSFSSFAVKDIPAAKRFYEDTLGIEVTEENDLLGLHVGGGHAIVVYPKPDHDPAVFTVLNLAVG